MSGPKSSSPTSLAQNMEQTAIFWSHLIFKLFWFFFFFLNLKCSPFYAHNPLSSREPPMLFPFIFGTSKHHRPQERSTSSKLSQRTQAGARAKSKGRRWAMVWEAYTEVTGWFGDVSWAVENLPLSPNQMLGALCVLNCSAPTVDWRMWLLIYTVPLTDHKMSKQGSVRDHLIQIQFPKEETGPRRGEGTCPKLYS